MIEGLDLEKIIPGHLESGWELDKEADLAHNRKYLDLFATKIAYAKKQPGVKEVYDTFEAAFPECKANLGFFLGKLSNQVGPDFLRTMPKLTCSSVRRRRREMGGEPPPRHRRAPSRRS